VADRELSGSALSSPSLIVPQYRCAVGSAPTGATLEAFWVQGGIAPFPTQLSNTVDENPWKPAIEDFLGRTLVTPPAEGRPPRMGWAH
jgi:manganese oxidase